MKLITKTNTLPPDLQKKIVRETIKWCKMFFGENNRRRNKFHTYVGHQHSEVLRKWGKCCGFFDCHSNKLCIYPEHNHTVRELIKTTIHEFTHYLQPVRTQYKKLDRAFGYDKNPLEEEARYNELNHYKRCWKSISPKFK